MIGLSLCCVGAAVSQLFYFKVSYADLLYLLLKAKPDDSEQCAVILCVPNHPSQPAWYVVICCWLEDANIKQRGGLWLITCLQESFDLVDFSSL